MKCGDSGQALGMGHCKLPGFSESFNMWNHFISWPGYPRLLSTQTTCALDMQLPWAPRLITERHLSRKPGFAAQQLFFSSFSRVKFQPQLAQTPRSNPLNQEASRLGNRLWIGTLDFFPPFLPLADGCIPFAYTTGLLNPGSIKSFPLHLQEAWPNLLGLLLFFNLLYVNKLFIYVLTNSVCGLCRISFLDVHRSITSINTILYITIKPQAALQYVLQKTQKAKCQCYIVNEEDNHFSSSNFSLFEGLTY